MALADTALDAFLTAKPRLFGIAYRMTGSVTEAEDLVQEAWLRWQSTDPSTVLNSPAFLATITTRLAINHMQSARQRRESYIGPWLPEPVDTSTDPLLGAERKQALSLAILRLLETLNPAERAAYILREAFAYSHQQIASVIETTEANARQLYARARKHIDTRPQHSTQPHDHRQLLTTFLNAAQAGDTAALEKLLAAEATSLTDGNGMLGAARVPVSGRERVAKLIAAYFAKGFKDVELFPIEANGEPSLLATRNGESIAVAFFNPSPEGIESLYWIMSPPKLTQFLTINAGDFSKWLEAIQSNAGIDVPCGTCRGCCRSSMFIHIQPTETATLKAIPKALQFPAPQDAVVMGYDDHGRCPMLTEGNCHIYEHRPQTCRDYDCRIFAATGVQPDEQSKPEIATRVRQWRFTNQDPKIKAALEQAAQSLKASQPNLSPLALALGAIRAHTQK